ncbi:hypothetical protein GF406_26375 [candidate division KSB1 bacterium]|nr:hypothetical protein [candidate division KSB1 bacterium]
MSENNTQSTLKNASDIQTLLDAMRETLRQNPFPDLQTLLKKMRELVMYEADIHPRHKERLLANIEDMQNLLDVSLLLGVEDIQRELNRYYPPEKSDGSILEKWVESIKRFFQEL